MKTKKKAFKIIKNIHLIEFLKYPIVRGTRPGSGFFFCPTTDPRHWLDNITKFDLVTFRMNHPQLGCGQTPEKSLVSIFRETKHVNTELYHM